MSGGHTGVFAHARSLRLSLRATSTVVDIRNVHPG